MKRNAFAKYVWVVLGYNVLVVLWGAYVRATGSGAGCGSHWPLCNGELIPRTDAMETIVEFSHRLTSGLLGLLVLGLFIWAFRAYERTDGQGRAVRRAASWTLFFVITEAALGAGLVKFEWVADNVSMERVYTMAFHLINTFFLLAANALTGWFASGGSPFSLRRSGGTGGAFALALLGTLILGASGAITALGDTLTLQMGLSPEDSPIIAGLVGLRIYHPLLAFGTLVLVGLAAYMAVQRTPTPLTRRLATLLIALFVVQLLGGALNVALKAPVWMQLIHLLISDGIWVALVLLAASATATETEREPASEPEEHATPPVATLGNRTTA